MSVTLEIPLRSFDFESTPEKAKEACAPEVKRCVHLRGNGSRCKRVAEAGNLCERHSHWYSRLPRLIAMPYPEDAVSLQETLARAAAMVMAGEMDAQRAQAVASLCRLMLQNLGECMRELEQADWDDRAIGSSGHRVI